MSSDAKMEISEAAKSGDGTLANVGIKVNGKFKSPVNNQLFDKRGPRPPLEVPSRSEKGQPKCRGMKIFSEVWQHLRLGSWLILHVGTRRWLSMTRSFVTFLTVTAFLMPIITIVLKSRELMALKRSAA